MATKEFIEKRIAGKEKELEKLTKKLARIMEAKESGWEKNPYYYHEDDIRWTERDIAAVTDSLEKYRAELQEEITKANSRNVPAILEFLAGWQSRMTEFFGKGLKEAFDELEAVRAMARKFSEMRYGSPEHDKLEEEYERAHKRYYERIHGRYEKQTAERYGRKYTVEVKVAEGDLEYVAPLMRDSYEESMARLKADLKAEADRKYDFIIDRTVKITGEITDASGLKVGAKGDLNGFIVGPNGVAKVTTIGAGGYNIQCFHFRTLIHREK